MIGPFETVFFIVLGAYVVLAVENGRLRQKEIEKGQAL